MHVQAIERLQNSFRPRPDTNVIGEVHPTDRSAGIDQKFCRSRNVFVIFPAVRMQNAVPADHLRVGIREEREAISLRLAELSRLLGGIDTDGDNLHTPLVKLAQALLETPQLGVAEGSPISAVENEHQRPVILEKVG